VTSYFMIENLMLTFVGALAGSVLALALNVWVSRYYEVPRIDPGYLVLGVGLVFTLGQLAAWVPARRAAREAPVAVLNSTGWIRRVTSCHWPLRLRNHM